MPVKGQPQGIPAPVGIKDQQVAQILSALREHILALHGTVAPIEQAYRGGAFGGGGGGSGLPEVPGGGVDPNVRPNPPVNLQATGIFGAIILTVDALPANAAYIEWLSATEDIPGNATVIGQSRVPLFNDYVGDNTLRYYWARAVGYGNEPLRSALNSTQGTPAEAARDPAYIKYILEGEITADEIKDLAITAAELADGIIDLTGNKITGKLAGVNLADAAVDTDKLADLSVTAAKLANGSIPPEKFAPDSTPPGKATNLQAAGAFESNVLSWVSPADNDIDYFEVFRNTTDSRATAVKIAETRANVYVDKVGTGATFYYWIRAVDTSDNTGNFNALAGTAATTTQIVSADLSNLAVTAAKIANGAINLSGNMVTGQLAGLHLADASVNLQKLADLSVTAAKLADDSVVATKIANAAVGNAAIANAAITNAKIANLAVGTAQLANAAISSAKIKNAAVGSAAIANAAINTAHIANAAITNAKIANLAVDNAKIANLSAGKLTAGTISAGGIYVGQGQIELDGSAAQIVVRDQQATAIERVVLGRMGAGSMDYGLIVRDASGQIIVDLSGLGQDVVGATQIRDLAVGNAAIANAAITNAKIGNAAIDTAKIANAAITAAKIGNAQVKTAAIGSAAITNALIANGAIDTANIRDLAVTGAKIKNLAANKIVAANLSAISANMGEVTSGTFRTGTSPNLRAEMSSAGAFPLWIGSGAKSANNAIFYVDQSGAAAFTGAVAFSNLTGVPDLGGGDGSLVNKSIFEDGSLGGWSDLAGDSGLSVGNVTGQPFTKALYSSTRGIYEENNVFPVSPGEQFYVSFWSHTLGTTYDSGLGLQFTDKSGAHTWIKINVAPGSNWQERHGVITAPADAVTARPWYQNEFTGTPGDTSQFTNVFIYRDTSSATEKIAAWARENHTTLIDGRSIYTGDAYVDTLQIKGDAVTVPMGDFSDGRVNQYNDTWQLMAQYYVPAGAFIQPTPVFAHFGAAWFAQVLVTSGPTGSLEVKMRIVVNGATLFTVTSDRFVLTNTINSEDFQGLANFGRPLTLAGSAYDIRFEFQIETSSGVTTYDRWSEDRYLTLLALRR